MVLITIGTQHAAATEDTAAAIEQLLYYVAIYAQKYTTPSHSKALATKLLIHIANSVLEQETGKQLNYGQLGNISQIPRNMEQIVLK